jgi:hypothetical protein
MVCVAFVVLQMRFSSCCTAALDGNKFIAACEGTAVLPAAAATLNSNNATAAASEIRFLMMAYLVDAKKSQLHCCNDTAADLAAYERLQRVNCMRGRGVPTSGETKCSVRVPSCGFP